MAGAARHNGTGRDRDREWDMVGKDHAASPTFFNPAGEGSLSPMWAKGRTKLNPSADSSSAGYHRSQAREHAVPSTADARGRTEGGLTRRTPTEAAPDVGYVPPIPPSWVRSGTPGYARVRTQYVPNHIKERPAHRSGSSLTITISGTTSARSGRQQQTATIAAAPVLVHPDKIST